jgi:hypothetical protein
VFESSTRNGSTDFDLPSPAFRRRGIWYFWITPPNKILLTLEFKSARFDRVKDTFCYLKTISV